MCPGPAAAGGAGNPAAIAGSGISQTLNAIGIPVNRWELFYRDEFDEWLRGERRLDVVDYGSPEYMILWWAYSAGRGGRHGTLGG